MPTIGLFDVDVTPSVLQNSPYLTKSKVVRWHPANRCQQVRSQSSVAATADLSGLSSAGYSKMSKRKAVASAAESVDALFSREYLVSAKGGELIRRLDAVFHQLKTMDQLEPNEMPHGMVNVAAQLLHPSIFKGSQVGHRAVVGTLLLSYFVYSSLDLNVMLLHAQAAHNLHCVFHLHLSHTAVVAECRRSSCSRTAAWSTCCVSTRQRRPMIQTSCG